MTLRRIKQYLWKQEQRFILSGGDATQAVWNELSRDGPSMIARIGSTEIKAILYPMIPSALRPLVKNRIINNMYELSGFFPKSPLGIKRFSDLMIRDMAFLDVLGSWRFEEKWLKSQFPQATRVELSALEPYLSDKPWSALLEGKKVLVVHPFSETIRIQYEHHRNHLFKDPRVLPEFASLTILKAVQTVAGNQSDFPDWFAALESMKVQITNLDFEVAILGCGAYGFPLAAHIKRMGKKAVHLGGATQILFGIRGLRWDDHAVISKLFNKHWARPLPEDTPHNIYRVENGCYW